MALRPKFGVITEQGDMGLGFDPISKTDQNKIKETDKTKKEGNKKEE